MILDVLLFVLVAIFFSGRLMGVPFMSMLLRYLVSPLLVVLFFISKRAFTWTMLEIGWPRRDISLEGKLYLRRFYITPPSWKYKVFLHHIAESDSDRDHHDHPFSFLSIILSGGYTEFVVFPRTPKGYTWTRRFGSVTAVPATHTHRVKLIPDAAQTWTFVIAGPTIRKWGFWILAENNNVRNDKWVDADEYYGKGQSQDFDEDRVRS